MLLLVFTAQDREVIVRDQARGAGRELGENAGRIERLRELPREGPHALQEVRDVGRVGAALGAGHALPVLGASYRGPARVGVIRLLSAEGAVSFAAYASHRRASRHRSTTRPTSHASCRP